MAGELISPMAWSRNQEQVALVLSKGYYPLSIFRKVTWLILETWAKYSWEPLKISTPVLRMLKKPGG